MKNIFPGFLVFFCLTANADLVGTAWNQQSELMIDGKMFCSFDQNKPATFHDNGGYLRVDHWNYGWFRIEASSGCAVGWFGHNDFVFQQVGSDVLDKNGVKIGTISSTEINLTGGVDWSGDAIIKILSLKQNPDGTAQIYSKFTHQNRFGYGEFEFTSHLTPWQY